jgi:hypothetical protein
MAALSLSAVAVGVYSALNVAGLTALTPRIYDAIPRKVTYPCVAYSLDEDEGRGLGTREMSECTLRVSTFSTSETGAEGQAIAAKVKELLKDATLTVSGYQVAGRVFWRSTTDLGFTELYGVMTREWVSEFSIYVEATS